VILTGEGADELFAGYRRYYLIQKTLAINKRLGFLTKFLPAESFFRDPRYVKMISLLRNGINYDYFTGINAIIGKERDGLLKIEKSNILKDEVKRIFNEKKTSFTNRLLYLDFNTYLQELLTKQDRMSMAASIESRVPFLDNEIISLANSIPSELKLNGNVGKYILRKAVRNILPESILKRKKIGFTVPLNEWFRKDLSGYVSDELKDRRLNEFFDRDYLQKLIDGQKRHNCSLQLWAILNFKLWRDTFFD
jgi:asparagine synthase (glutamine-hydrolysing)